MNLAISFSPKFGESITGYCLRLAEANFVPSISWIAEIPVLQRELRSSIGVTLFGRIPKWLTTEDAHHKKAWADSPQLAMGEAARYCPTCLHEDGYWRAHWEHAFYTVCHIHGLWMRDKCASCGELSTWDRASLTRCICGSSFANNGFMRELSTTAADIALAKLLFNKLTLHSNTESIDDALYGEVLALSVEEISSFIKICGGYALPDRKKLTQLKLSSLVDARPVASAAAALLAEWPGRFHHLLDSLSGIKETDDPSAMPKEILLLFTKAVNKTLNTKGLHFVIRAQREYMTKNWYRVLDGRNKWATEEDSNATAYVAAPNAARMLGISWTQLRQLLAQGHIKAIVKRTEKNRKIWHVEKASLAQAKAYFGDRLTTAGVAMLMGIPEIRVEELDQAGLLTATENSMRPERYREYSKLDVLSLMTKLRSYSKEANPEKKP